MFKQIILDNQELIKNIKILERDYEFYYDLLLLKKIVSFVGPRRTGKTFLMYSFVKQLIKKGKIELEQVVFIDFSMYSGLELDSNHLLKNYKELFPNKTPFFVFDEIQDISNFKNFVLSLYNKQFQIFLSGSNSNLLSSELTTHFRGRIFQYNILPLTFNEVLRFNNIEYKNYYSTTEKVKLSNILKETLEYGSFPEIVLSKNNIFKIDNLKTYLDILIYKDLLERYKIDNEFSLRYLIK
ncbi:MAG: AAA family ATPase, partial [Candidatus Gracilibacteria bacterium]|nr:AAA family ATPase [Candidatus Gracilibacteria bacterium]